MTTPAHCPQCGKPLPEDSAHEICPACLLGQGLATGTLGAGASTTVPALEEIAGKFPQFEILECLGRGGMGVVYKARQKSLNRLVAIKILAPERIHDGHFAARFSREAEILARLNHPHIVTIHDFGETDGLFYLVMEFVDGVNLREILRDGRMEPKQALAVVPEICDALQYAHDQGIVHRDIKPENILLDRLGRVKVADFGIAKLAGAEADGAPQGYVEFTQLTEAGKVLGTPAYMAPEQIDEPASVDHRADIYALGAVFYQMLTGETPKSAAVPPSRKVAIDVRLDEIVLRALERNPDLRYQKVSDVRSKLDTLSTPPPVPAKTGLAKWIWIGAAILFALMIFTIASGTFWFIQAGSRKPFAGATSQDSRKAWEAWEQQRFPEAKEAFEKNLQADPKNANDWNGLGWTLFNSGKPADALSAFEKAVSLDPNQPGSLNGIGQIALAQGDLQKAEEYLLRAAPIAPAAWFGLARIYLLRGEYGKALPWAQKIADTGQGGEVAQEMLEAARKKSLSEGLRNKIKPQLQKSAKSRQEPQLRALAWLDEVEKGQRDKAWNRDGKPVNLSSLDVPRSVEEPVGMNVSASSAAAAHPRFLCAWISSPEFDNQSVANLTLLDSAGRPLATPGEFAGSQSAPATPENHNLGWLGITVCAGAQSDTRDVATLKLRSSGGPWDARGELSPGARGVEPLDTGVQAMPPAQNNDGKATIQLIQDRGFAEKDLQWDFVAITSDGRRLERNGFSRTWNNNIQTERFVFDAPLSKIHTFEIRSRPIRTTAWKDVPLVSTKEIVLRIEADGRVAENGRLMNTEETNEFLRYLGWRFSRPAIILQSVPNASYLHVQRVLEACAKAGLTNVAFASTSPEGSPAPEAKGD